MISKSLIDFKEAVSSIWGPLNSELTFKCKLLMKDLINNCKDEDWVKVLIDQKDPNKELLRSEDHGFILMSHLETVGDISPPHDHGKGWVIYATLTGRVEMGHFNLIQTLDNRELLVQKDQFVLEAGECNVYLPGDIHDTRSIVADTLMLRLTSCDFNKEVEEGRLKRYDPSTRWK